MKYGFVKVAAGVPKIRVADTKHNADQIIALTCEADALGVKVLALPELCITGYTCGDLFLQDALLDAAEQALLRILAETADTDVLCAVGLPLRAAGKLYNCAALLHRGEIVAMIPKTHLPNYAEFDEMRWFTGADEHDRPMPLQLKLADGTTLYTGLGQTIIECENLPELKIGVELCEDIFCPDPPSRRLAEAGATLILNLSASTEQVGKTAYRHELIKQQSARLLCSYVYANAGEGESSTDIVFSGHKIIAENGSVLAESRFDTGLLVSEIDVKQLAHARRRMSTYARGSVYSESQKSIPMCNSVCFAESETVLTRPILQNPFLPADSSTHASHFEDILTMQSLGLKQRMEHTGVKRPVIGVSGGLDSTLAMLVAARALDRLGLPRENLLAVTMPCFGTTARTRTNAQVLAERLGAEIRCVDITESVKRHFADIGHDENVHNVVFENAQARTRTQVLMDIANGCGGLVVGTGDLSELALGWATYNGDHMSMYAVNSGIPKTVVRHLVQYAADSCGDTSLSRVLCDILATPVSPELLPAADGVISQKTEDLVGPYELHDFFLYYLIRQGCAPDKVLHLAKIAFAGVYSGDVIKKWLRTFLQRFFSQQFKRSCLPDGVQVFSLSLSPRGSWHMPSDATVHQWIAVLD